MPDKLFDLNQQLIIQKQVIAPTEISGFTPFINPPYTSIFFAMLSFLPYFGAFTIWVISMLVCLVISSYLIAYYIIPDKLRNQGLSPLQLIFICGSFFPFIVGFQVGQNHGITLLICTILIILILEEKDFQSGLLAGLLIYKPQFVLGFLIFWFAQKNWKSIIGFGFTTSIWIGISLVLRGIGPFIDYFNFMPFILQTVGLKETGSHFEITTYSILIRLFGRSVWNKLLLVNNLIMTSAGVGLGIFTYQLRKQSAEAKFPSLLVALLFPLIFTPHALIYDAVILIPFFVIWARWKASWKLIYLIIIVYLSFFLLTFLAYRINFPLMAFIPIGLFILLIHEIISQSEKSKKTLQELTSP